MRRGGRMSILEKVLASEPVDITARLVTQQSTEYNSVTEELEALKRKVNKMKKDISLLPKRHPRYKHLCKEYSILCLRINSLKPKMKFDKSFSNILLDVIKEDVNRITWMNWVEKAENKANRGKE